MKAYELMLILDPGLDEEAATAAADKARGVITAGGSIDSEDPWGKRKLAYEIEGHSEGDYTVIQFHATTDTVAELDRVLHITDAVIRYMIVRRDDLE